MTETPTVPPLKMDVPKSRVDRTYAVSLAITVALIVALIVGAWRQSNQAKDRAERGERDAVEVANLLRGQLAVAFTQLAKDAAKDKCRDAFDDGVGNAAAVNALELNRYIIGLSAGPGGDVVTLLANLNAAGEALSEAQSASSQAAQNGYNPESCPTGS